MPMKFCHSIADAKETYCPMLLSADLPSIYCLADACMAWRFVRTQVKDFDGGTRECGESHGFCGLAVDPRLTK